MSVRSAFAVMLALAGCARHPAPDPRPLEVEIDEVSAHRLSDLRPVRDSASHPGFDQVAVRVLVGADGRVLEARMETDPRRGAHAFPAAVATQAVEQARRQRFRPFTRNEAAIPVTFVDSIPLYPPELRPSRHAPMPPFDGRFRIVLERTACFGTCPRYRVEIAADGSVLFTGEDHVFARGAHRARIAPAAVRGLYDLARRADFFSLRPSFRAGMTDNPTYAVTVAAGGSLHSVEDYVGETVGMPSIVVALEDAIDAAAGTRRWIEGDESLMPGLIGEGFDFRGYEGARMLAAAAAAGKTRLVSALSAAGAPLSAEPAPGSFEQPVAALAAAARGGNGAIVDFLLSRRTGWSRAELHAALAEAARGGNFDAFRSLARRGALAGITRAEATQLLRGAAERGNARLVAVALRLDPEVNRIDPEYPNPPILAEASHVTCRWDQQSPDCDPAIVVLLLLRAGADPRLVNRTSPMSPLGFVSDVRVARMLLAAGADPNFVDFDGATPIFSTYHEEVALALLDAGANPRARRPADRMTVAGWSLYQQWPRVLERLRAQGIRP